MGRKIGCDPEVFIRDAVSIISGIGIVGGTKEHPRPVEDGTLQEDNVLAEIGIIPADTEEQFVIRITSVLSQLRNHLQNIDPSLDFVVQASAIMDPMQLLSPAAMMFGCEPDFNAWTGLQNPKPQPTTTLRTAGGHVHIGYDDDVEKRDVIKACDVLIGLPSVLMDNDPERMKLYGGPGAFRPKPYGVEYRTPSNYWLQSQEMMRWIFRQAYRSVDAAKDAAFMEIVHANESRINRAISRADRELAGDLCQLFGVRTA